MTKTSNIITPHTMDSYKISKFMDFLGEYFDRPLIDLFVQI